MIAGAFSPAMGLHGVGVSRWMTSTLPLGNQTLVPIPTRTFMFFLYSHIDCLELQKWNHTHGWLYWWFTFTANGLTSVALISLQQATRCEVMYWSQQSVSLCREHCFDVVMPEAQKALFSVTAKRYRAQWDIFLVSSYEWSQSGYLELIMWKRPRPLFFFPGLIIYICGVENCNREAHH